jgi:hypothetical protein
MNNPRRCVLLVLASAAGLLAAVGPVAAQPGPDRRFTEAAARLAKLVHQADQQGFKYLDEGVSLGGALLKPGKEYVNLFTVQLEAGERYLVLAVGNGDATDVDVQLVDEKGKTVSSVNLLPSHDEILLTPKKSQKYQVRVRLYHSHQEAACVCLAAVLVKR